MKSAKKWLYFALGLLVAFAGVLISDILVRFSNFFRSFDSGDNEMILAYGFYLCTVMVTCTGIIVSKINEKHPEDK